MLEKRCLNPFPHNLPRKDALLPSNTGGRMKDRDKVGAEGCKTVKYLLIGMLSKRL